MYVVVIVKTNHHVSRNVMKKAGLILFMIYSISSCKFAGNNDVCYLRGKWVSDSLSTTSNHLREFLFIGVFVNLVRATDIDTLSVLDNDLIVRGSKIYKIRKMKMFDIEFVGADTIKLLAEDYYGCFHRIANSKSGESSKE